MREMLCLPAAPLPNTILSPSLKPLLTQNFTPCGARIKLETDDKYRCEENSVQQTSLSSERLLGKGMSRYTSLQKCINKSAVVVEQFLFLWLGKMVPPDHSFLYIVSSLFLYPLTVLSPGNFKSCTQYGILTPEHGTGVRRNSGCRDTSYCECKQGKYVDSVSINHSNVLILTASRIKFWATDKQAH